MKIVVIGGTGLIGSKTVTRLRQKGHEVIAASPNTGVNTITGDGLAHAMAGTDVVVDLANSPSFEDRAVLEFFQTSGRNLLAAEAAAGVRHHVALSVVGTDRLQESGYFRGKLVQENLIKGGAIPYTIVRSTQFFEFMSGIANAGTIGQSVHISPAPVQPISSDDVADAMAKAALAAAVNGMIEIAGPERLKLSDLIAHFLEANADPRSVVADPQARYFGALLNDGSLVPGAAAHLGATHYESWIAQSRSVPVGEPGMSGASVWRPAMKHLRFAAAALLLMATDASAQHGPANFSGVTLVYDHVLPNVPGKSIKGVMVEYAPGGSSPAHTHPQSAFIYATVLEGAIRSQVNGGPIIVYKAGESFSEMPGDRHGVSENASATQRARLLAVFVVDTAETTLATPTTK